MTDEHEIEVEGQLFRSTKTRVVEVVVYDEHDDVSRWVRVVSPKSGWISGVTISNELVVDD